ncbi:MAG: response regulator transcription factor [Candidatus Eremiobacteraeota bacterium]|nr:response regulator transcription factor [Candidatus Eremiobacteraeota bacterium]
MIDRSLRNLGFDVKIVSEVANVARAIAEWAPEAIVLGLRLPSINAFGFIESLRRITEVPILLLSGAFESDAKVRALMCGADDYLAEPFDWQELAACIRARLRRPRLEKRDVVTYADVTIDLSQRRVARAGKAIDLSAREFDLLVALARHPEHVFTRSQLLDMVWGMDRDVAPATVETYISYLRAKLDSAGVRLIHTLRGVGYTMRLKR